MAGRVDSARKRSRATADAALVVARKVALATDKAGDHDVAQRIERRFPVSQHPKA